MAADIPLPKRIFAHGWLLFENDKMSKSRGNIVRAEPIRQVMGLEALRYFLFREVVFGQDGSFSYDALVGRYNSELANGLGNLASRTLTMIKQYRDGVIPGASGLPKSPPPPASPSTRPRVAFDALEFSRGLEAIWSCSRVSISSSWNKRRGSSSNRRTLLPGRNSTTHSTHPRRRCVSRSHCFTRYFPNRPLTSGRNSA